MIAPRRTVAMAAASGALIALCWLPTGLAPLLPLSLLGMMRALRRCETGKDAIVLGLVFGALRYAVASHFLLALLRYSLLAVPFYLMAIAFILPLAVVESRGALALERRLGVPRSIGFGILYVACEKLRTLTDLSFPADLLAHSYGTDPAFLGWAPMLGPHGVTATLFAIAVLLDLAVENRPRRSVAAGWATAAVALWIGPVLTTMAMPSAPQEHMAPLRVAVVQPDTPLEEKLDPARRGILFERLRSMTIEAARGSDLVLWPETARPGFTLIRNGRAEDPDVAALAREVHVPILFGTTLAEVDGRTVRALYNGAALALPDGTIADWYGKQQLLPFVEGVPFASFFGLDPKRRASEGPRRSALGMLGNFSRGPRPTLFQVGGAKIGVLICYEGMYPELARTYELAGANALVVLTNDAWWGRSAFAPWHAHMIASRVRELELPVVRAANSGVSSETDDMGRYGASTAIGESVILRTTLVPVSAETTFYARHGDWVVVVLLLVPAFALAAKSRRRVAFQPTRRLEPQVERSRQAS